MKQTTLNRLDALEERLRPLAPTEKQQPIQIWRVSRTEPRLYRREFGGPWLTEDEYQAELPPAPAPGKRKRAPRIVEVAGDWREFRDIDRT